MNPLRISKLGSNYLAKDPRQQGKRLAFREPYVWLNYSTARVSNAAVAVYTAKKRSDCTSFHPTYSQGNTWRCNRHESSPGSAAIPRYQEARQQEMSERRDRRVKSGARVQRGEAKNAPRPLSPPPCRRRFRWAPHCCLLRERCLLCTTRTHTSQLPQRVHHRLEEISAGKNRCLDAGPFQLVLLCHRFRQLSDTHLQHTRLVHGGAAREPFFFVKSCGCSRQQLLSWRSTGPPSPEASPSRSWCPPSPPPGLGGWRRYRGGRLPRGHHLLGLFRPSGIHRYVHPACVFEDWLKWKQGRERETGEALHTRPRLCSMVVCHFVLLCRSTLCLNQLTFC